MAILKGLGKLDASLTIEARLAKTFEVTTAEIASFSRLEGGRSLLNNPEFITRLSLVEPSISSKLYHDLATPEFAELRSLYHENPEIINAYLIVHSDVDGSIRTSVEDLKKVSRYLDEMGEEDIFELADEFSSATNKRKWLDDLTAGGTDRKSIDELLSSLRQKVADRGDDFDWDAFYDDFGQNAELLTKFDENPRLVENWKVIKSVDDPVLAAKAADVAELELVSKYLDDIEAAGGYSNWKAFDNLFSSSRQRAIEKFGKEAEDLIYVKYHDDGGAAAEILDHYGTDGLNALKKASTIDGAASELVKNKTVYRAVNETTYNFDKLKTQGIIDASPVEHPAYVSLDNYTDANTIQQKLQLPKKPTWVAEFDGNQIVNDVRVPNGKFLTAEYKEVLCRSYPEINGVKLEGGGSQFITNSEIKVSKLINLETGEVITFTH